MEEVFQYFPSQCIMCVRSKTSWKDAQSHGRHCLCPCPVLPLSRGTKRATAQCQDTGQGVRQGSTKVRALLHGHQLVSPHQAVPSGCGEQGQG